MMLIGLFILTVLLLHCLGQLIHGRCAATTPPAELFGRAGRLNLRSCPYREEIQLSRWVFAARAAAMSLPRSTMDGYHYPRRPA